VCRGAEPFARPRQSSQIPNQEFTVPSSLIKPHGGHLVDLIVDEGRSTELRKASRDWQSVDLNERQVSDLELLLNGGFSPLKSFMGRVDYHSVVHEMRLADGTLWPIPIVLDVPGEFARGLSHGEPLALRDP
jgi:sulfate adenylyltransferase